MPLTDEERQNRVRYLLDSAAFVERTLMRRIQELDAKVRRLECECNGLRLLLWQERQEKAVRNNPPALSSDK